MSPLKKRLVQVLPSDLFGGSKWPFQGLSDLHLGDQKVTWKKMGGDSYIKLFLFRHQKLKIVKHRDQNSDYFRNIQSL